MIRNPAFVYEQWTPGSWGQVFVHQRSRERWIVLGIQQGGLRSGIRRARKFGAMPIPFPLPEKQ